MGTKRRASSTPCIRHILAGNGSETTEQAATLDVPRRKRGRAADTPVAQLMSRDVLCVRDDMSLEAVRALMLERGIGGAPVVDENGMPRGVVSKTDLVRALGEGEPDWDAGETMPYGFHVEPIARALVRDVMTPIVIALPLSSSVADAAELMVSRNVHRVIVVDADGAVVGLVSAMDVVRWLAITSGVRLPS